MIGGFCTAPDNTFAEHTNRLHCWQVLRHKFRVKLCWATSKLLNAFLVNTGLLLVMHILNTRVSFFLEERSPLPFAQVSFSLSMSSITRKEARDVDVAAPLPLLFPPHLDASRPFLPSCHTPLIFPFL